MGFTLSGKEIPDVFGAVPKADYIDSIRGDIAHAVDEIMEEPVYMILNLCRVLAYLRSSLVLSKAQGVLWGIENLPSVYRDMLGLQQKVMVQRSYLP